jgi:hypothetical protein
MIPLLFGLLFALQNPTPTPTPTPAQTPPAEKTPPAAEPPVQEKVQWTAKDLPAVLKDAKADSKLVLLYFRQDGDAEAELVSQHVLSSDEVAELLKDRDLHEDRRQEAAADREPVQRHLHADLRLAEPGRHAARPVLDVQGGALLRRRDLEDQGGRGDDQRAAEEGRGGRERPRVALRALPAAQGVRRHPGIERAEVRDPEARHGRHVAGSHHFAYDRITSDIERYWSSNGKLPEAKIAELQTFVEMENIPEIIWDGWMRLANTYAYFATQAAERGKFADAAGHRVTRRACLAKAWRGLPGEPDYLKEWCTNTGTLFWNERDELTPDDKEFLMTMAKRYVDTFPNEGAPYDMFARAYFLTGKRVQAIEAAEEAVKKDPTNKDFQERLKLFRGS